MNRRTSYYIHDFVTKNTSKKSNLPFQIKMHNLSTTKTGMAANFNLTATISPAKAVKYL